MIIQTCKTLVVNCLIVVGLLLGLNIAAVIMYQLFQCYQGITGTGRLPDRRGSLPNYQDSEWAAQHFRELAELRSEYKSFIGWKRLAYTGETITINEEGIRATPQPPEIADGAPQVVFLGGSTMWGTGADDSTTIPALFAEAGGGRYRVMNLGEAGYTAFQGYILLVTMIQKGLKPDLVISYDGVNEGHYFYTGVTPPAHKREHHIRTQVAGSDSETPDALTFRHIFLEPMQAFITRLKQKYGDKTIQIDPDSEQARQAARGLLDSWMATKNLAETHGATFIAVLQPAAGFGTPQLEHLTIPENDLKPFRVLYPAIRRVLREPEYRELSETVLDITDIFNRREYIYIDFCHVSPNGNRLIAEQLYTTMTNAGILHPER